ncbi:hypothetical protein BH24ACT13_BH24ACT13_01710 [soil metagenome]
MQQRQRAILAYAEKLTRTSGAMGRSDVSDLVNAGLSEVLDVNQITDYFAYVNRLADGLGVPLEDYWPAESDRRRSDPELPSTS